MSDIVERLRDRIEIAYGGWDELRKQPADLSRPDPLAQEAADEIERLRALLREAMTEIPQLIRTAVAAERERAARIAETYVVGKPIAAAIREQTNRDDEPS